MAKGAGFNGETHIKTQNDRMKSWSSEQQSEPWDESREGSGEGSLSLSEQITSYQNR